ncbi:DNA-processing protein DprA [Merdibacter massiliensis]|uniref:DNA-processing protein DprA n=1 Tax=Merdibacter massiliensis TaxID=1871030 RepID=UPI00096A8C6F|nr:DNA-processing protein DprA [Merdibacter massiliensis]
MREQILSYAIRYEGNWQRIAMAIQRQEPWYPFRSAQKYITVFDAEYPKQFRHLRYPPWILFYHGDLSLLEAKGVAVIGSRVSSEEGRTSCQQIVGILKEKYVIISGLAKGIDALAHREALDQKTIGVIGCGIECVYPKENADLYARLAAQHLIISEYPGKTKPYAAHFPWRNRLIAALADSIIVIEAKVRSGTMHTVNEAIELSRPVYVVVRSYLEREYLGNALLLQQGAEPLFHAEDVQEL